MKSFKQFILEDGMAVPGPTNVVSGGGIAGTGEKGGEPGVYMKRKRAVVVQPMQKRKPPKM